jgi:hypothetical protein
VALSLRGAQGLLDSGRREGDNGVRHTNLVYFTDAMKASLTPFEDLKVLTIGWAVVE